MRVSRAFTKLLPWIESAEFTDLGKPLDCMFVDRLASMSTWESITLDVRCLCRFETSRWWTNFGYISSCFIYYNTASCELGV
jgi:hypothetical protein